jgi:hypothetical protein
MLSLLLRRIMFSKVILIGYIVLGLVVANSHKYLVHLSGAKPILSAVLGVALWPLVLVGVNLHIK